jgi:hypothetical protein
MRSHSAALLAATILLGATAMPALASKPDDDVEDDPPPTKKVTPADIAAMRAIRKQRQVSTSTAEPTESLSRQARRQAERLARKGRTLW